MTVTLFARPYDFMAQGFYFESLSEFNRKSFDLRNAYGQPVEEFEIQFIDGDAIDAELADALGLHQGNIEQLIQAAEEWDVQQKRVLIIAARECGYLVDIESADPDSFDIEIYEDLTMLELAMQFVDEGLFGEIPEHLAAYIDYEAIARDLAMDYAETTLAGARLIYREA